MNLNIELNRKPEDYRLDNCVIDCVEEIDHDQFETFQNYPTARYSAITNCLHQLPKDTADTRHCIMLLDSDGNDGFLVNPHGADYARYSAFVPNARQICRMLQYPSLDVMSSDMESLVNHYALEIKRTQADGQYHTHMDSVNDYYLAEYDRFLNDDLFLDMLSERPEVSEIEEHCGEVTVKINPAFKKSANVRNLSQKDIDVICANHTLWLNNEDGEQADLSNCVLEGLFLCGRDLSNSYCPNAVFKGCNIHSVNFSGAELESARFESCDLKDMLAIKTNFIDAVFDGCDLTDATLSECRLMNAAAQSCLTDNCNPLNCEGEMKIITYDAAEGLSPIL